MDLEQQLRAALVVCEPGPDPLAAVMAELSRQGRTNPRGRRGPGRIVLVSSMLALAAVAGMVAMQQGQVPAQIAGVLPVGAGAAAEVPPELAPVVHAETRAVDPPSVAVAQDQIEKPEEPVPSVASTFSVLVQPLRLDTSNRAVESRVREYFSALLDELRAVPGLVLVTSEDAAARPADFRITVNGGDTRNSEYLQGVTMWQVSLQAEVWRDHAYRQDGQGAMAGGTLNAVTCPQGPGLPKCGPAGNAANAVAALLRLFPSNPELDALRARIRERVESQNKGSVKSLTINLAAPPGAVTPMDEKVVQAILARIAAVPEPGPRAALWLSLRGQKYPDQLPLLLKALREETADVVRKEVITQLALDFTDDPAVRATLVTVAAIEPQALPRHVAQRAVSGDASWRDYLLATLRDTTLPTAQRLDPLNWMIDASQRYPRVNSAFNDMVPALLDSDGARMLADLLARKQNESAGMFDNLGGMVVVARLSVVDHPAVPDLLVAYFDAMPSEITLGFLAQRRNDPRVQKKLEAIAANDAYPKLRQQAASYLRQAPTSLPALPGY